MHTIIILILLLFILAIIWLNMPYTELFDQDASQTIDSVFGNINLGTDGQNKRLFISTKNGFPIELRGSDTYVTQLNARSGIFSEELTTDKLSVRDINSSTGLFSDRLNATNLKATNGEISNFHSSVLTTNKLNSSIITANSGSFSDKLNVSLLRAKYIYGAILPQPVFTSDQFFRNSQTQLQDSSLLPISTQLTFSMWIAALPNSTSKSKIVSLISKPGISAGMLLADNTVKVYADSLTFDTISKSASNPKSLFKYDGAWHHIVGTIAYVTESFPTYSSANSPVTMNKQSYFIYTTYVDGIMADRYGLSESDLVSKLSIISPGKAPYGNCNGLCINARLNFSLNLPPCSTGQDCGMAGPPMVPFDGIISRVKIFNTKLTNDDIKYLYEVEKDIVINNSAFPIGNTSDKTSI